MSTHGPSDALLGRILAALAGESSGERVRALVQEARAEAEGEIKALLKQAMKAALLREAADVLESERKVCVDPAALEEDAREESAPAMGAAEEAEATCEAAAEEGSESHGCYVYAITREASTAGDPAREFPAAIDPRHPVKLLRAGDVAAVVSTVDLQEFSRSAVEQHLRDPAWVEARLRAHDAVVKHTMAAGPVIPCRFCTILRDEDAVRGLLLEHREQIGATLETLRGKEEWGVKIYLASPGGGRLRQSPDPPVDGAGKAYLQRKGDDVRAQQEHAGLARQRATARYDMLASWAADAVLLPARNGHSSDAARRLLVNAALLVPKESVAAFQSAAQESDGVDGIEVELTGPWPPYNFVHLDLAAKAAAKAVS